MNFSAVIFDMDGLLLDTEAIALKTFEQSCKELHLDVDRVVYFQCLGTNTTKTEEILKQHYGDNFPINEIARLWSEKYRVEAVEKAVPLKAGVRLLLDSIKKAGLPTAVATSTEYAKAIKKLKNAGIFDYFRVIAAGDQVKNSKPDPEIYLLASKLLNVEPSTCLALEDSENGVRSALAAGMTVIQIPDLVQPSEKTKQLGHIILNSLADAVKIIAY